MSLFSHLRSCDCVKNVYLEPRRRWVCSTPLSMHWSLRCTTLPIFRTLVVRKPYADVRRAETEHAGSQKEGPARLRRDKDYTMHGAFRPQPQPLGRGACTQLCGCGFLYANRTPRYENRSRTCHSLFSSDTSMTVRNQYEAYGTRKFMSPEVEIIVQRACATKYVVLCAGPFGPSPTVWGSAPAHSCLSAAFRTNSVRSCTSIVSTLATIWVPYKYGLNMATIWHAYGAYVDRKSKSPEVEKRSQRACAARC